jgi:hypothetical protein
MGGGGVKGFVDTNNLSPRAIFCQKTSGIKVYKINEISDIANASILIFGVHADEIAENMNSRGLIEGQNYIKTGLL